MHPVPCLMFALLAVAGCNAQQDPFERAHTWAPTGVNEANLRVMVADPNDLAGGVDEPNSLSAESTPAVRRLLTGQRRPLPVVNASSISTASAPPPAGADAADPAQAK